MADPTEMVERVARALEEVYASATKGSVDTWGAYARAAISSMREPTEDMETAADVHLCDSNCRGFSSNVWGAMIDAALGPQVVS